MTTSTLPEKPQPITLDAETFDVFKHDGVVRITNPATGRSKAFRIRTSRRNGTRFIGLLAAETGDWIIIGVVRGDQVYMHNDPTYQTYGRMLANPQAWAAKGCEYHVGVVCRRCGRPLTNGESVATGIGPVCSGR